MEVQSDDEWFSPEFLPCAAEENDMSSLDSSICTLDSKLYQPPTADSETSSVEHQAAAGELPILPHSLGTDAEFKALCDDPNVIFTPRDLGFLPRLWANGERTFGELRTGFFRKKNG
jgi:hypothetical protein